MSDTGRDAAQPTEAGPAPASPVPDAASTTEAIEEQEQQKLQQHEQEQQQAPAEEDEPSPAESLPDHPPFEPLFTLLTNSSTNTTIHPRVHYLFSDDDPSVLTTPSEPSERALVVDLSPKADATGWDVSWAASLSPDFAVTGVRLEQKDPSKTQGTGHEDGGDDGGSGGQQGEGMLRVEGVEREPVEMRGSAHAAGGQERESGSAMEEREDVEGLMEDFRRRMGVLKKIVGEGERRRNVLGKEEQQHQQHQQQDTHQSEGLAEGL